MNQAEARPAVCQIDNCGVLAIGRCATCGRAFCPTHQGWDDGTLSSSLRRGPYVDMCAPCFAVKKAEEAKRRAEAQAPYMYFESDAARTALFTAGVPPVKIYEIRRKWKTGLFGLGGRDVDVVTPIGHGWILGEFRWKYQIQQPYDYKEVVENCLTALLDLSHDNKLCRDDIARNKGLVRVRSYLGSYEVLLRVFERFEGNWQTGEGWREVAQAVKRLTGESS